MKQMFLPERVRRKNYSIFTIALPGKQFFFFKKQNNAAIFQSSKITICLERACGRKKLLSDGGESFQE